MPGDWQRIVFDNSPIYVKADAKGNRPSTLRTLKNFLRPSPRYTRFEKMQIGTLSSIVGRNQSVHDYGIRNYY